MRPYSSSMSLLLALGLALAAAAACHHPSVTAGTFSGDPLEAMQDSPLLVDVGPLESKVPAQEPSSVSIGTGERGPLNFAGTPLPEAINAIARLAGVNIVLDPTLSGTVDASFPAVTLDEALHAILDRNGLRLVRGEGNIYWVERGDGSEPAMHRFQLRSVRAADIEPRLKELVLDSSRVVIDQNQNLIMVRGTRGDVNAIGQFLESIDQIQKQVLIEVHIFEVRLDDDFEFGVQSSYNQNEPVDVTTITQNLATPGNAFSINLVDDDFSLTVEALRRYVGLELLSSPRVMTVSNREASIEVVEEIPYVQVTAITSGTTGGIGSTVQETVEFKEAGIRLKVTPTIQAGGILQILVDQELSEVIDFFNSIPVLDTRKITTQFLVNDGETVVLGGLMQDRHSEENRGVPLLMHVPFIGRFFRSDEDTTTKRELLLFVTSRILDPGQAARLAPIYQQGYLEKREILEVPVLPTKSSGDAASGAGGSGQ
jgi:type II secretory pathway component GspD/PulD (secretin)